jgi:hypothetical protein
MTARQHFLIALGALTLCSGAALAAAQDEGQQPSPETTTQPALPQAMPPEQSNMEDQMLTRSETERSNASESAPVSQPRTRDAGDENVAHLVQSSSDSAMETPRSMSMPQPSYPQQTEDQLSARTSSDSSRSTDTAIAEESATTDTASTTSTSATADVQSGREETVAQAAMAQPTEPLQDKTTPPERTSTLDETSVTRASSPAPPASEQPVQSESPMDQGNTQLSDATASVQAKFDALDADHDGTIDRQEASASDALASQFDALDSSGDGKLSLAEFSAASNLASIRVDRRVHQE